MTKISWPKRLAHRTKRAWHALPGLDAWLDRALTPETVRPHSARHGARNLLLRLFPERALRESPFAPRTIPHRGRVCILALTPPEDTGGGSRPAQLAAELHRRGFFIEWHWALPIYPWPRRRRPVIYGVDARPLEEVGTPRGEPDFVLLEAPHPKLIAFANETIGRGPMIYDAIDQWNSSLGAGWFETADEDGLLEQADVLIASARPLQDRIADRTGRTVQLIPNAVDTSLFRPNRQSPPAIERGNPTVVYVGALWGDWVDLELIEKLARKLPDAVIHLFGPSGTRRLPHHPNLFAHGPRPRKEIPGFLAAADVAIIPFVRGPLSEAVSPLKVFEYLSMHCPVVSTPLPEVVGLPGVTTVNDHDSFIAAVEQAPLAPFPRDTVDRFVAEQTWSKRVDQLLELIR